LGAFAIGGQAKYKYDFEAMRRALKPLGESNTVQVASQDNHVTASLNGTIVTTISAHNLTRTIREGADFGISAM